MRPIAASIDFSALRHNYDVARRCAPHAQAMAVIKANAYGHGLMRAARALHDADGYALIELDGAVRLRESGYRQRITLLEGFFEQRELAVLIEHDLTTVLHSTEQLAMLHTLPAMARLDVWLKVNTGMNRLGLQPSKAAAALDQLRQHSGIRSVTLMTHFANADDAKGVAWQLE